MKDQEACPLRYQGKRPLVNEDEKSDCDYPYCPALWDPSSLLAKPLHVSEDPLFSSCLPSFVLSPTFFEHGRYSGGKSGGGDQEPFKS